MFARLRGLFRTETIEGYEHPELIDVVYRKTMAYEPEGSWQEMEGARTVLDFGGACGIHYKQAKSSSVRWAVVESPAMVAKAKSLETENLRFFTAIDAAADWLGEIDVMHSNGALQYVPDTLSSLRQLCSLGATTLLWYRVDPLPGIDAISYETQTSRLVNNGPGRLRGVRDKNVIYTKTILPEKEFLTAHGRYSLVDRGRDWFKFTKRKWLTDNQS